MKDTSSSFLNALHNRNEKNPPVWIMRQAGRYLPEFRALREKYSLIDLFRNPDQIALITQMPLKRFPLDAAIVFSDILYLLEASSIQWDFYPGQGPVITPVIKDEQDVQRLHFSGREKYTPLIEGIIHLKKELLVPLIGFAGGPFTLVTYLVEGQGTQGSFTQTKKLMYQFPQMMHALLEKVTDAIIFYLEEQITAGVDALQIFDSWAGFLSVDDFHLFATPYLQKIALAMQKRSMPTIVFCRGSSYYLSSLNLLAFSGISLDGYIDIKEARKKTRQGLVLQGNVDPDVLLGSFSCIREKTMALLNAMHADKGFIVNLAHGIRPQTPLDAVKYWIDLIKESKKK